MSLDRIIGEVFPENLASARVLEETRAGAVVKGGKTMDVSVYGYESCSKDMNRP